jgi:hypothetical protein
VGRQLRQTSGEVVVKYTCSVAMIPVEQLVEIAKTADTYIHSGWQQ